ncbi:hypothetical protein BS47DRAFT_1358293 [Hydnum rufescens UP504]|uniref:DRBM domain-containing protein n=1 Tax=Hydnum rufescens UP504 TaxID=1448309 RepID=A0A9P6E1A1_9AGAM|nr:hypothetical protein BS47DRAFT_1358293 [Hydnum rufescens UP504]
MSNVERTTFPREIEYSPSNLSPFDHRSTTRLWRLLSSTQQFVRSPLKSAAGMFSPDRPSIQATKGAHTLRWEEHSDGPPHQIVWYVLCRIDNIPFGAAADLKKNIAKDQAARIALISLGVLPPPPETEQNTAPPDGLPYAYAPSYTPGQAPSYPPYS